MIVKFRVIWAIFCIVLLSTFSSANAFARCYSTAEAEADQGIRIHSELMVIGLNCQHMGARYNQTLYMDYRDFTARHAELFATYERLLLAFYNRAGEANPEARLNDLRTQYANKISKDAASMRPDIFCSRYAQRITKASAMERRDVRKWAATFFASHPVSYPLCDG